MNDITEKHHRIEYQGQLGAIYKIWFKNLLLQILTLGIYRFWAKTNMRRYLWSAFSFEGEAFEYTGTGGELFKGFLKVALLIGVPLFTIQTLAVIWQEAILILYVAAPFFLLFVGAAAFSAIRYRLSRTNWRGIRGGLDGSIWKYGWIWVASTVCIVFSFSLAFPLVALYRARYIINRMSFGNWRFSLDGKAKSCFLSYFIPLIVGGVLMALSAMFLYQSIATDLSEGLSDFAQALQAGDQTALGILIFIIIAVYGAIILVFGLALIVFSSAFTREIINHIQIGTLHLELRLTVWDYIRMVVLLGIMKSLTLSIAAPLVTHWRCRFIGQRLQVLGKMEPASLGQSEAEKPKSGEGLLEAMDVDLAL